MVLTEEVKKDLYPALSFEGASGSAEVNNQNAYWENRVGQSIDVLNARTNRPGAFATTATHGDHALLLRKSTGAIGATKLLKVMGGDKIHVKVDYFFANASSDNSGANGLGSVVASLLSTLQVTNSLSSTLKGGASTISNQVNVDPNAIGFFGSQNGGGGADAIPKAYLHVLLFDEMFKFDAANSFVQQVANTPNVAGSIDKFFGNAVEVRKNGYAYVYISNESESLVYFDNFLLTHERGSLLEETHYYPFGLTMAGISSQALNFGQPENKRKFNKGSELQNKEFSDGSGLEWYATQFRIYDPQVGRWHVIDPKPNEMVSPYVGMENNPIIKNDPLGDTIVVDKRGYIVKQYGKDNLVFLQKGKKLTQIGELGKTINASKIFKNLLNKNIDYAKGIVNPNTFRNLVKNKSEWDLKNNQKTIYGLANSFDKGKEAKTQFSFEGNQYTAEELGNYHYGATGKAVWLFSEEFLLKKAGEAQVAAGTSKPEWQATRERRIGTDRGGGYITMRESAPPYGDDPNDQEMIKRGFTYYDANKKNLQEED